MPYRNIGSAPLTSLKTELAKIGAGKRSDRTSVRAAWKRRPGVLSDLVFQPVQNGTIVHLNFVVHPGNCPRIAGR
jgi:hypothetical protein